jgi:hypothetical protein
VRFVILYSALSWGNAFNRKDGKGAQDYFECKIILNFEFAIAKQT